MATKLVEYKLKNGFKILAKQDHRSPIAIFQIFYKVGSSYERGGITGVSHALEHMMFRGTRKYDANQVVKTIASFGAQQNAFTTSDCTAYYEILPVDYLEFCFQYEADRMQNLLLTEKDFSKEIQIVMEERRMSVEDNPKRRTLERFYAAAYLSTPYQHPILGWMEDLQNMTVADLREWYQTWYVSNNAVAVVIGDVEPNKVIQLAKKYFGPLKSKSLPIIKPRTEIVSMGARTVTVKLPAKLPWLVMGYNTPVINTADEKWEPYALYILGEILAGSASARLQQSLVRGSQVALEIDYRYSPYDRLNNVFAFFITPAHGITIDILRESVINEIKILQTHAPAAAELKRVKAQIIASKTYQDDSIASQAMELGGFESVGISWRRIASIYKSLEKVTPSQVQKVCQKYFVPDSLIVANLEPLPISKNDASTVKSMHSKPEMVK